jgi:hypothetical protein
MLKSYDITRVVSCYPVLSELPPELKLEFVDFCSVIHPEFGADLFDLSKLAQSYVMLA